MLDAAQMVHQSPEAEQSRAAVEQLTEQNDVMSAALLKIAQMELVDGPALRMTWRELAKEMQRLARVALAKVEGE